MNRIFRSQAPLLALTALALSLPGCDQLCGPGTTLQGGICVADLECGPGTVEVDGMCICSTPCADEDFDGVCDEADPCPSDPENDADGDGLCGAQDPCPSNPDPECVACTLDADWEEIDTISVPGSLHFGGQFAQHPSTGEVWYLYTRYSPGFADTAAVVLRYDDVVGAFVEDDVYPLGGALPQALAFDTNDNLWATMSVDGRPLLRMRASDGSWTNIDFGTLEPDAALSAAPRYSVPVGDDLWIVGDTCLGPEGTSETGDGLRAYLIVWKYSMVEGTVERVEQPITMVGDLNDGTPINLSNQGVVSCRRTFPGRIIGRPNGQAWVIGGTSSWDDPDDPTDNELIRSEAFVYEGDMTGFVKVLEHRPVDYRSDESFSDAVVVGDSVYLSHTQREGPGQESDWRILNAPLSDLEDLTEVDHFMIEPGTVGQMDQAGDLLFHGPSMQVFGAGLSADAAGRLFGAVRVGDAAGFDTSLLTDPPDHLFSVVGGLFADADSGIWVSETRFDGADFDPADATIRRLRCD